MKTAPNARIENPFEEATVEDFLRIVESSPVEGRYQSSMRPPASAKRREIGTRVRRIEVGPLLAL
jgi:hypothetical protein